MVLRGDLYHDGIVFHAGSPDSDWNASFENGRRAAGVWSVISIGRSAANASRNADFFQAMSPLDEWLLHEICAGTLEHVEDQQNRRTIRRRLPAASATYSQPSLKSAEVCAPVLIGDDDLAIEDSRRR